MQPEAAGALIALYCRPRSEERDRAAGPGRTMLDRSGSDDNLDED